jgi:hypothetical protein
MQLAPPPNAIEMVSELITPTQVLAAKMAITSNCDDDEEYEIIASLEFEGNSLPT